MGVRTLSLACVLLVSLAGCGGSTEPAAEEAPPAGPAEISGLWQVEGVTVTKATGRKRQIEGSVVLAQEGGAYTATFSMKTTYPGGEQDLDAEVIGKGEGTVDGRVLTGTAQTQLVMGTVPGVDSGFAFIPRMVSTRIVSSSTAQLHDDGTITIEIANEPAPGEEYAATATTLTGTRVGDAGSGIDDVEPRG